MSKNLIYALAIISLLVISGCDIVMPEDVSRQDIKDAVNEVPADKLPDGETTDDVLSEIDSMTDEELSKEIDGALSEIDIPDDVPVEPLPGENPVPEAERMPEVYSITVEAETGEMEGEPVRTYIGSSSRGPGELYLAEEGVTVDYSVDSLYTGPINLYAYVSDDGIHGSSARDAIFLVNEEEHRYEHVSENLECDGNWWAWRFVGTVWLSKGSNSVRVWKPETTSAAFTMDKFEFTTERLTEAMGCCRGITDDLGRECRAANYTEYISGSLMPYFNDCKKADAWIKSSGKLPVRTIYCDQAFKNCYEDCSNGRWYHLCDMLCYDEDGFEMCYSECSPEGFNGACDKKCD